MGNNLDNETLIYIYIFQGTMGTMTQIMAKDNQ